jgi:hypothetical protein
MIIELQRQWFPGARMADDDVCGVCGQPVEEELSIVACAATDGRTDMDLACLSCVEYLGKRNPEKFPTIEVYRELLRKYPEPMYPSAEALEAASEEFEDPSELVWDDSWVWTSKVPLL